MNDKPDDETERGGTYPAETESGKRQIFACYRFYRGAVDYRDAFIERHKAVVKRGEQCEAYCKRIDLFVVPEEFAEQREQYQHYRKRVQEHQHGYGVGYNVAQSEVGEYERKRAENYCPSSVIRSVSAQLVISPTAVFRQARVTVAARTISPAKPR